ncbi:hypothetical protein FDH96_gp083 [Mycobacterium phage Rey]|uniref:Uncharacterized protein n=1 Tax=Mycobacterium phage Rey TaxID=1034115 RepID=G1D5E5_9CAUD|nr:hypothetical protein FDH96_gp083 [Mycobacterium phage Rey]AEK09994.1 hypothetical protein PBI_REY_83 [Mycobacterium phage Rey]
MTEDDALAEIETAQREAGVEADEVKAKINANLAADPDEETAEEAARKDKFHRILNRRMRRDMSRLRGEIKTNRSRIRRRVYRVRAYYEGK